MPQVINNLDLKKNEIQNAIIQPLSAAPSNPKEGQVYYNTSEDNIYRYSGNAWIAHYPAQIPYAQVDSTSTSTAFTATVPGVTEYKNGVAVFLKNGRVTSAAGFTIDINGLGAKPVYSNLAAATADSTIFNVNYTMLFIYDESRITGGCWVCYRGYNSNDNYLGYQIRTNSTTLPVSDTCYRYRLLFTSADGTKYVPANTSTSTNATAVRAANQRPINPFGRICEYLTTTALAAGNTPGVGYLYDQYAPTTLGYSFNTTGAALTLTVNKPVYIKCAPQSDGSAIIDAITPYVQDLPSTADGKIYIFLGIAYSATQIELFYNKPVYEYKNGAIRLWTNADTTSGVTSIATGSTNGTISVTTNGVAAEVPVKGLGANAYTDHTNQLVRPAKLSSANFYDPTIEPLIDIMRANRLAFLPASQIIIEQTTDGGITWTDRGVSDDAKTGLFSEKRYSISIPLLNGVKNINCGLRITFTAMKYDVPDNTAETEKYNYWNSTYVVSNERYCQLRDFYFFVGSNSDGISLKIERATGAAPNTWVTAFDSGSTWAMTGWSGSDYARITINTFGGSITQTNNYWNYRMTFFTRGQNGGTTLSTSSTTTVQGIYQINGYGNTVWTPSNNLMRHDHIYTWDVNQNTTFPANITATKFIGPVQGNADTATKVGHTLTIGSTTFDGSANVTIPIYNGASH